MAMIGAGAAAVHQGLLCEPEVGEVRLEEGDASPGPDGTG